MKCRLTKSTVGTTDLNEVQNYGFVTAPCIVAAFYMISPFISNIISCLGLRERLIELLEVVNTYPSYINSTH